MESNRALFRLLIVLTATACLADYDTSLSPFKIPFKRAGPSQNLVLEFSLKPGASKIIIDINSDCTVVWRLEGNLRSKTWTTKSLVDNDWQNEKWAKMKLRSPPLSNTTIKATVRVEPRRIMATIGRQKLEDVNNFPDKSLTHFIVKGDVILHRTQQPSSVREVEEYQNGLPTAWDDVLKYNRQPIYEASPKSSQYPESRGEMPSGTATTITTTMKLPDEARSVHVNFNKDGRTTRRFTVNLRDKTWTLSKFDNGVWKKEAQMGTNGAPIDGKQMNITAVLDDDLVQFYINGHKVSPKYSLPKSEVTMITAGGNLDSYEISIENPLSVTPKAICFSEIDKDAPVKGKKSMATAEADPEEPSRTLKDTLAPSRTRDKVSRTLHYLSARVRLRPDATKMSMLVTMDGDTAWNTDVDVNDKLWTFSSLINGQWTNQVQFRHRIPLTSANEFLLNTTVQNGLAQMSLNGETISPQYRLPGKIVKNVTVTGDVEKCTVNVVHLKRIIKLHEYDPETLEEPVKAPTTEQAWSEQENYKQGKKISVALRRIQASVKLIDRPKYFYMIVKMENDKEWKLDAQLDVKEWAFSQLINEEWKRRVPFAYELPKRYYDNITITVLVRDKKAQVFVGGKAVSPKYQIPGVRVKNVTVAGDIVSAVVRVAHVKRVLLPTYVFNEQEGETDSDDVKEPTEETKEQVSPPRLYDKELPHPTEQGPLRFILSTVQLKPEPQKFYLIVHMDNNTAWKINVNMKTKTWTPKTLVNNVWEQQEDSFQYNVPLDDERTFNLLAKVKDPLDEQKEDFTHIYVASKTRQENTDSLPTPSEAITADPENKRRIDPFVRTITSTGRLKDKEDPARYPEFTPWPSSQRSQTLPKTATANVALKKNAQNFRVDLTMGPRATLRLDAPLRRPWKLSQLINGDEKKVIRFKPDLRVTDLRNIPLTFTMDNGDVQLSVNGRDISKKFPLPGNHIERVDVSGDVDSYSVDTEDPQTEQPAVSEKEVDDEELPEKEKNIEKTDIEISEEDEDDVKQVSHPLKKGPLRLIHATVQLQPDPSKFYMILHMDNNTAWKLNANMKTKEWTPMTRVNDVWEQQEDSFKSKLPLDDKRTFNLLAKVRDRKVQLWSNKKRISPTYTLPGKRANKILIGGDVQAFVINALHDRIPPKPTGAVSADPEKKRRIDPYVRTITKSGPLTDNTDLHRYPQFTPWTSKEGTQMLPKTATANVAPKKNAQSFRVDLKMGPRATLRLDAPLGRPWKLSHLINGEEKKVIRFKPDLRVTDLRNIPLTFTMDNGDVQLSVNGRDISKKFPLPGNHIERVDVSGDVDSYSVDTEYPATEQPAASRKEVDDEEVPETVMIIEDTETEGNKDDADDVKQVSHPLKKGPLRLIHATVQLQPDPSKFYMIVDMDNNTAWKINVDTKTEEWTPMTRVDNVWEQQEDSFKSKVPLDDKRTLNLLAKVRDRKVQLWSNKKRISPTYTLPGKRANKILIGGDVQAFVINALHDRIPPKPTGAVSADPEKKRRIDPYVRTVTKSGPLTDNRDLRRYPEFLPWSGSERIKTLPKTATANVALRRNPQNFRVDLKMGPRATLRLDAPLRGLWKLSQLINGDEKKVKRLKPDLRVTDLRNIPLTFTMDNGDVQLSVNGRDISKKFPLPGNHIEGIDISGDVDSYSVDAEYPQTDQRVLSEEEVEDDEQVPEKEKNVEDTDIEISEEDEDDVKEWTPMTRVNDVWEQQEDSFKSKLPLDDKRTFNLLAKVRDRKVQLWSNKKRISPTYTLPGKRANKILIGGDVQAFIINALHDRILSTPSGPVSADPEKKRRIDPYVRTIIKSGPLTDKGALRRHPEFTPWTSKQGTQMLPKTATANVALKKNAQKFRVDVKMGPRATLRLDAPLRRPFTPWTSKQGTQMLPKTATANVALKKNAQKFRVDVKMGPRATLRLDAPLRRPWKLSQLINGDEKKVIRFKPDLRVTDLRNIPLTFTMDNGDVQLSVNERDISKKFPLPGNHIEGIDVSGDVDSYSVDTEYSATEEPAISKTEVEDEEVPEKEKNIEKTDIEISEEDEDDVKQLSYPFKKGPLRLIHAAVQLEPKPSKFYMIIHMDNNTAWKIAVKLNRMPCSGAPKVCQRSNEWTPSTFVGNVWEQQDSFQSKPYIGGERNFSLVVSVKDRTVQLWLNKTRLSPTYPLPGDSAKKIVIGGDVQGFVMNVLHHRIHLTRSGPARILQENKKTMDPYVRSTIKSGEVTDEGDFGQYAESSPWLSKKRTLAAPKRATANVALRKNAQSFRVDLKMGPRATLRLDAPLGRPFRNLISCMKKAVQYFQWKLSQLINGDEKKVRRFKPDLRVTDLRNIPLTFTMDNGDVQLSVKGRNISKKFPLPGNHIERVDVTGDVYGYSLDMDLPISNQTAPSDEDVETGAEDGHAKKIGRRSTPMTDGESEENAKGQTEEKSPKYQSALRKIIMKIKLKLEARSFVVRMLQESGKAWQLDVDLPTQLSVDGRVISPWYSLPGKAVKKITTGGGIEKYTSRVIHTNHPSALCEDAPEWSKEDPYMIDKGAERFETKKRPYMLAKAELTLRPKGRYIYIRVPMERNTEWMITADAKTNKWTCSSMINGERQKEVSYQSAQPLEYGKRFPLQIYVKAGIGQVGLNMDKPFADKYALPGRSVKGIMITGDVDIHHLNARNYPRGKTDSVVLPSWRPTIHTEDIVTETKDHWEENKNYTNECSESIQRIMERMSDSPSAGMIIMTTKLNPNAKEFRVIVEMDEKNKGWLLDAQLPERKWVLKTVNNGEQEEVGTYISKTPIRKDGRILLVALIHNGYVKGSPTKQCNLAAVLQFIIDDVSVPLKCQLSATIVRDVTALGDIESFKPTVVYWKNSKSPQRYDDGSFIQKEIEPEDLIINAGSPSSALGRFKLTEILEASKTSPKKGEQRKLRDMQSIHATVRLKPNAQTFAVQIKLDDGTKWKAAANVQTRKWTISSFVNERWIEDLTFRSREPLTRGATFKLIVIIDIYTIQILINGQAISPKCRLLGQSAKQVTISGDVDMRTIRSVYWNILAEPDVRLEAFEPQQQSPGSVIQTVYGEIMKGKHEYFYTKPRGMSNSRRPEQLEWQIQILMKLMPGAVKFGVTIKMDIDVLWQLDANVKTNEWILSSRINGTETNKVPFKNPVPLSVGKRFLLTVFIGSGESGVMLNNKKISPVYIVPGRSLGRVVVTGDVIAYDIRSTQLRRHPLTSTKSDYLYGYVLKWETLKRIHHTPIEEEKRKRSLKVEGEYVDITESKILLFTRILLKKVRKTFTVDFIMKGRNKLRLLVTVPTNEWKFSTYKENSWTTEATYDYPLPLICENRAIDLIFVIEKGYVQASKHERHFKDDRV
ncbi:hypothetical protein M514_21999 [Trichuris suis]|uniref:Galectin domain-containing protein n=1 Tax=Trichuris suis TaxID=68888 RepID=A0A085N8J1_9BILA|nr:hypothetical protein M514_21999 [Trichuris suis]